MNTYWQLHKITYQDDHHEALSYLQSLEGLAEQVGDEYWKAKAYFGTSAIFIDEKLYGEALPLSFKSAEIFVRLGKGIEAADNFYNLGKMFSAGLQWDNSIAYYEQALKYYEQEGQSRFLPLTYIAIGGNYVEKGEYETALKYYNQGIEILKRNDSPMLNWGYNMLGALAYEQGNYHEAREYYLRSIEIPGLNSIEGKKAIAYNNIGESHLAEGNIDEAFTWLRKAKGIKEALGNREFLLSTEILLAEFYIKKKLYKEAVENLQAALLEIKTDIYNEGLIKALATITRAYDLADKSYRMQNVENIFHYSKLKDKQIQYLSELKANLETLNNEYIIQLSVEQYTNEVELKKTAEEQKLYWTIFILATLLLGFIVLLLYFKYKKINALIRIKSKTLDEKNRVLNEKTKMLNNLEAILKDGKQYIESQKGYY